MTYVSLSVLGFLGLSNKAVTVNDGVLNEFASLKDE